LVIGVGDVYWHANEPYLARQLFWYWKPRTITFVFGGDASADSLRMVNN
jgi:hypothetical protein